MITIEELKKNQSRSSRLIGIDLGTKRIGIAICDENQKISTPFKTLQKEFVPDRDTYKPQFLSPNIIYLIQQQLIIQVYFKKQLSFVWMK